MYAVIVDDDADRDRALDETLEETFPASDAPANTVETGTRVGADQFPPAVTDENREDDSDDHG